MSNTAIESHKSTLHKVAHYSESQIRHLQESATNQEKIIARFFYHNPDHNIGPGRLHEQQGYEWPVTSTRRAITNLTTDGILVKTEFQSAGPYGRPEHHWQWRNPKKDPQANLFE